MPVADPTNVGIYSEHKPCKNGKASMAAHTPPSEPPPPEHPELANKKGTGNANESPVFILSCSGFYQQL
jgi:hypothetical protein